MTETDDGPSPMGGARVRISVCDSTESPAPPRTGAIQRSDPAGLRLIALTNVAEGFQPHFDSLLAKLSQCSDVIERTSFPNSASALLAAESRAAVRRARLCLDRLQRLRWGNAETLQKLCVNDVIGGIRKSLRREAGVGIDLVESLDEALRPILASPSQVATILVELIRNAAQATGVCGRIAIRTSNAPSIPQDGDSPGVVLSVADAGCGMSADCARRAFDPFFTTRRGADGLGLSLVEFNARPGGGVVRLFSRLGLGTTVEVYWPAY